MDVGATVRVTACEACGGPLLRGRRGPTRRWCDECRQKPQRIARSCAACGAEFVVGRGGRRWCETCLPPVSVIGQTAYNQRWQELTGYKSRRPWRRLQTCRCGVQFVAVELERSCPACLALARARSRWRQIYVRACRECGHGFWTARPHQHHCTRKCSEKVKNRCRRQLEKAPLVAGDPTITLEALG